MTLHSPCNPMVVRLTIRFDPNHDHQGRIVFSIQMKTRKQGRRMKGITREKDLRIPGPFRRRCRREATSLAPRTTFRLRKRKCGRCSGDICVSLISPRVYLSVHRCRFLEALGQDPVGCLSRFWLSLRAAIEKGGGNRRPKFLKACFRDSPKPGQDMERM